MKERKGFGMLVVRAWLHDQLLVARVTRISEVDDVAPISVVVTGSRQVQLEVATWLRELGVEATQDQDPDGD